MPTGRGEGDEDVARDALEVRDVLGEADAGVEITAVADDGEGGCWFAGVDGSFGQVDANGNVELIHLPEPDPGHPIHIEVASPSSAWLLTDTGTWRVQVRPGR